MDNSVNCNFGCFFFFSSVCSVLTIAVALGFRPVCHAMFVKRIDSENFCTINRTTLLLSNTVRTESIFYTLICTYTHVRRLSRLCPAVGVVDVTRSYQSSSDNERLMKISSALLISIPCKRPENQSF